LSYTYAIAFSNWLLMLGWLILVLNNWTGLTCANMVGGSTSFKNGSFGTKLNNPEGI